MTTLTVVKVGRDGVRRQLPVKGAWQPKEQTVGQTVSRRRSGR